MSELDKMMAFGRWLTERRLQFEAELCSLAIDRTKPIDALRIKAGHLEAATQILKAFTELYKGDLGKFMVEYMGQSPEEEESDGATETAS